MTQEDKQLLFKDLCMRLPYDTIVIITGKECFYKGILTTYTIQHFDDWDVKPYLRPMSSMTEEEHEWYIASIEYMRRLKEPLFRMVELINWLNANHFDYRGFIPKGLAIEVTKENNPYE